MKVLYGDKRRKFPDVKVIEKGRLLQVMSPFVVESVYDGKKVQVLIPIGMKTDGASIPMFAQNIMRAIDECLAVYIKHDACYAGELFDRPDCDMMLLEDLKAMKTSWLYRNTVYSAVRIGGGFVWGKHTAKSKHDFKELLDTTKELLSIKGNQFGIWLDLNTGLYRNEWQVG